MIYRYQRFRLPWISKKNLLNINFYGETKESKEELVEKWNNSRKVLLELSEKEENIHEKIGLFDIDEKFSEKLSKITQHTQFMNTYTGRSFEFKLAEIDKIIAYQNSIRLDFVEKLQANYPKKPTAENVFDSCLSLSKEYSKISKLKTDDFNYIFSSDSSDFRLIDVLQLKAEETGIEKFTRGKAIKVIAAVLGFPLTISSAYHWKKKVILFNGCHRIYTLRALGITHVPILLIKDPSTEELEIAGFGASPERIAKDNRPPLMKDFFDKNLTFDLVASLKKNAIKVMISTEQLEVPM